MKKICGFVLALLVNNFLFAQDPAVNGAVITPSPGVVNGQGKFSFNFQNLSGAPIVKGGLATTVTISFNKLAPVLDGGNAPQITGAGADFFDWTYALISGVPTITGTQKADIPGAGGTPVGGTVSIDIRFTAASAQSDPQESKNGGNVNIQTGSGGNIRTDNDNTSAYAYTDGALPVAFGFTSASFTGGKLKVEWETFSEKNNKSFIIEGSKDGETFVQIDQVSTQAADGNSSEQIKYTYSKSWQEIAAKFGFSPLQLAIMALLVISVVVSAKRAKKGAMLGSLVLLITIGIGCRKEDRDLDKMDEYPTTFVRIGQVNKDGTTVNYSKVVKVVAE